MAEPIGLTLGGLSLATLFSTCVECMDYIILGRNYGRDYEHSLYKLDLLKARLVAWGQSLRVTQKGDELGVLRDRWDQEKETVEKCLVGIKAIFDDCGKLEKRYGLRQYIAGGDSMPPAVQVGESPTRQIEERFKSATISRQENASLWKKTTWAIHDKKKFDSLISDVAFYIDGLEKLSDMLSMLGLQHSKDVARTDYLGQYSYTSLRPVANYVPRPALRQKLEKALHDTFPDELQVARILAVVGLGGAGKSQLVLNYIQEYRRDYSAVFWIDARQNQSIERDFQGIFRLLFDVQSAPGQEGLKTEEVVLAVKNWFYGRNRKYLFVFDSADEIDDKEDEFYVDLRHFLPDAPSVHVVITTRSGAAREMTRLEAVEVKGMEPAEATELFIRCAKLGSPSSEVKREATSIVEELGYLALAISLAGAYVSATPRLLSNIFEYLPEYHHRRKELLGRKPKQLVHEYGESILTTWETTFSAIARRSPEASRFLTLLAFLHFNDIFLDLFDQAMCGQEGKRQEDGEAPVLIWQTMISPNKPLDIYMIEEAFRNLQLFSLVEWKQDQKSYSMHKLVHAWGYDRLNQEDQAVFSLAALQLLTDVVEGCRPDPTYKIRLAPHLLANFAIISNTYHEANPQDEAVLDLLLVVCDFLDETGRWSEEFMIRSFVLGKSNKLRGNEHPDTISAVGNLAIAIANQGKLDEAAPMMREVLEKRKRIFGDEHPDTIRAMGNLVNTLGYQSKLDEAASMEREILEKMKRILGDEHPDSISAMGNLASTLRKQGKLDEAAPMMREVLEKRKRILGDEHPDTISAMGNLANTLGNQGKLDEAASMQREVLEKRKRILGDEHPDTIRAMGSLASTLRDQDKLDEAAPMKREVLEKRKRILGDEHPDTIRAMGNLASTLRDQSKLDEAASMEREVLEKLKRILGDEHLDTIRAMGNLASTLGNHGKLDEAASMEREALEKRKRILGDEHPDTIRAMGNLASTLRDQGKLDEAASMMREVLEKMKRILGDEHPDTIRAMGSLASTLRDQGKLDEAASMQREVLEKRKRILGDEHSDTISAMGNLANTLGNQGKLDEAASMQREVLEKRKRILGDEHLDTIRAVGNLANTLRDQGKLDEAASMQREVLEKRKRILGDEHPDTIRAMGNLANALGDQGKLDEAASMEREVLEKMKRILGDEHPDTITAMSNLASTLGNQGKLDEAASMKREVLEKRKRILRDEHPDTITAMNNLANTLVDQGKLDEAASMQREVLEKRKRILGDEHPRTISATNNFKLTLERGSERDEREVSKNSALDRKEQLTICLQQQVSEYTQNAENDGTREGSKSAGSTIRSFMQKFRRSRRSGD